MQLTKKQERAVENGRPVRLRTDGLDCVVIRADLYDRVASLFDIDQPSPRAGDLVPVGGERTPSARKEGGEVPIEPWRDEEDVRRCELIDKDIEGTITGAERLELKQLQQRFHEYLDTVAPPPIDGARRLHQELLT